MDFNRIDEGLNNIHRNLLFGDYKKSTRNHLLSNFNKNYFDTGRIQKKILWLNDDMFSNDNNKDFRKTNYRDLVQKTHRPKSKSLNLNFYYNSNNNNNNIKDIKHYKVYSKEEIKRRNERKEFENFANFNIKK
jgi:hypothetical protein